MHFIRFFETDAEYYGFVYAVWASDQEWDIWSRRLVGEPDIMPVGLCVQRLEDMTPEMNIIRVMHDTSILDFDAALLREVKLLLMERRIARIMTQIKNIREQ